MAATKPAAQFTDLEECLQDFQHRFNTNPRVAKLVKNWDRQVVLEATDNGTLYTLAIKDRQLQSIDEGRPADEDEYLVHLQASYPTLMEIFSGNYNPSTALLDGMLSVFSNERDKVKLEACAMVIWGL
ncbi:MAG: SCP2 sterol-binding domain-containing protein [Actinomycetota bacterium]|nr:SCP2 sterol-binding domain-containing protein [Actinomycetota bacterium]